jgi:tetratricopeptide (TPR) repeat protein
LARRTTHEAGETLLEIQSFADHLVVWLHANWIYPAAVVAVVVVVTGIAAGFHTWREHGELAAANAVAAAQRDFFASMGAQPGSFVFEEPANPETGKKARREAADRFQALAREHDGTAAAAQARIEAAALLAQAGNTDQAIELWRGVLASGATGPELAALVQVRIAQTEEAAGRWSEAAKAYQAAGEQRAYPLWSWALADAARCLLEAGDRDQAVRIAERLRTDAPDVELPPHLADLLQDLRGGSPAAPRG